ncbi:MAG: ArsR/SmtB family transcription factor [Anaerolineae bacterium]
MDDLSAAVLDRLIEKTFENMSQEERLDFIERLFAEMTPENQARFLRRMIGQVSGETTGPATFVPPFVHRAAGDAWPRDIGPWHMCYRMMIKIDRAPHLESLDATHPTRVFGALADETRIKVVKLLTEGERRVDDLTQALHAPQSTISHHLRILKEAGLVQAEKRGRSIYYSLAHPVDVDVE